MIESILASPYFLPALFFFIALLYSSVGLGGGSSYTALMAISGINYLAIPIVSLTLNLMVTTLSSFHFIRNGHARLRIIAPFIVSSIPMAYLGGALKVSPSFFYWVLLVSLLFLAARIYFWNETRLALNLKSRDKIIVSVISGSILGLIAGIVGIGGGIYLVPLILLLGLGTEKQAAACGAIIVWMNSFSGLASRMQYNTINLLEYASLIIAVLAGGFIGSYMGSSTFSAKTVEKILGLVIIIAIIFLLRKLVF